MASRFARHMAARSRRILTLALPLAFLLSDAAVSQGAGGRSGPGPEAQIEIVAQADARSEAGDWRTAAALWQQAVTANPVNGRFWIRLGSARLNSGDLRGAIAALERAVALGSAVPADQAFRIAVAYVRLGETEPALQWLERALTLGFRDIDRLPTEEALAPLRSDPRFWGLIHVPANLRQLSRAEGWRSDLAFLLWQMDRIAVAPYRIRPRGWFEQQFAAIAASAAERSDIQITMTLATVLRDLGDGHSGIAPGRTADWALSLPLLLQGFDDGVYIVAADPRYRELVGAQVLEFGGRPIDQVMAAMAETVARDNESNWIRLQAAFRLRYTALAAAGGMIDERDGAVMRLRLTDGTERVVRVAADTSQPDVWNQQPNPPSWLNFARSRPGPTPLYLRHPERPYWFEYLPEQRTVYFGFNSVRDGQGETLAQFADRLRRFIDGNPVERLVIDLRWNNGGNTTLLPPLINAVARSDKVNRTGRLFVLIGPRTFSAAQNATTMLERFTNPIFVGEPTGSSPSFIGEEEPFALPYSGVMVNLSTERWLSGWSQEHRVWIAPAIYAPVRFSDLRDGRDPAMDAILALSVPG